MDSLFYVFAGLRWQDGLDILLNSYVLFRLYVLFRGTNVIRVLLAVCVIWAVSQIAVPLGLIITNWAMQGFITVAAFIIIIIFRNEISSVLQTRNLKSFLWGIPQHQFHTPLDIIVESVYEMAEKKIGALIVLPLKQGLANVVQGGVPINAKLSQEMLTSIFWPGNPVHDGAAIIQGDLITAAGVIFPLSKREDLPSYFGTRHRAAAGLAELTDALVIVVSEERGLVSLFKEDQIHAPRNRSSLQELLGEHAGDDSKKGFRHQTIELVAAATICLFCVTGIWLRFSTGMETLSSQEIPIEFINPDQKMEIISSSTAKVKLLISGAMPLINSIKPEQIKVKLNLSHAVTGINKLSVTQENIVLPPGLRLKKIEPTELDITLDKMIVKELPIQAYWIGKLPKGLVMTQATALPQTIRVSGGEFILKDISTIFTEKISLDKLSESGTITAGLVLIPASLKSANSNKIQIQYIISKKEQ